jgi:hypothetical protein
MILLASVSLALGFVRFIWSRLCLCMVSTNCAVVTTRLRHVKVQGKDPSPKFSYFDTGRK